MHKIPYVSFHPLTKYKRRAAIKVVFRNRISLWKLSVALLPSVNILTTKNLAVLWGRLEQYLKAKQISTVKYPVQSIIADNRSVHEARVGQHCIH